MMFANKSKILFISSLLGLAYTAFLSVHFFSGAGNAETEIELLAGIFALALVIPHIITVALGTLLCILAFFLNARWLAITAGISFIAAAILFMLYGLFVLPMIVLCFVGAAMAGKIKMTQHDNLVEDTLQDKTGDDGRFRGKMFGGFHRADVISHMHTLYGETEQLKREKQFYQEQAHELQHLLQTIEESLTTMESLAQQEGGMPVQELKSVLEEKPELQAETLSVPVMEEEIIEDIRDEIKDMPDGAEITLTEALLPETAMEQPYFTIENVEEGTFGAPPSWSMPQEIVEPESLPVTPEEQFIASQEVTASVEEPAPIVEEPTFVVEQPIAPAAPPAPTPAVEQSAPVVEKPAQVAPKVRPTLSNPYPGQGVQRVKVRKV